LNDRAMGGEGGGERGGGGGGGGFKSHLRRWQKGGGGRTRGYRPNGKWGGGVLSDLIVKCTEQIGEGLGNVKRDGENLPVSILNTR